MTTEAMSNTELYELCKAVYEATGWHAHNGVYESLGGEDGRYVEVFNAKSDNLYCPLYTSDYLLEKLPKQIGNYYLTVEFAYSKWSALYTDDNYSILTTAFGLADTPLKALLKLTIALKEDNLL